MQHPWQCLQLGWELIQYLSSPSDSKRFDPLAGSIGARVRVLGLDLDLSRLDELKRLPPEQVPTELRSLVVYVGNQIRVTATLQSAFAFGLGFDLGLSVIVHTNIVNGLTEELQNVAHVQDSIRAQVDKIDIDPDLVNPVLETLSDATIPAEDFADRIVKLTGQLAEILENPPARSKVFVVMPFSEANRETYETIKTAARRTGYFAWRSDDRPMRGELIDEVFRKGIEEAAIVVIDLTDNRQNVYMELGMVSAQKKPSLVIARTGTVLPFDASHLEVVFFDSQGDLEDKLKEQLRRHAQEATPESGLDSA